MYHSIIRRRLTMLAGSPPVSRSRRTTRCTKTITGTRRTPPSPVASESVRRVASECTTCRTIHVVPVPGPAMQSAGCAVWWPSARRFDGLIRTSAMSMPSLTAFHIGCIACA